MAVDSLSSSSTSSASKSTTTKKKDENSPEAIQERFMSLLVAQLKNQDPMEPMDNAQVTSQMAQLNTVTGINNLNTSVTSMSSAFTASQTVGATSMLGRTILTEGNTMQLADGKALGSMELNQSADSVQVNVLDKQAKVLRTLDMGAQAKGTHQFEWDGKDSSGSAVAAGSYTFEIVASAAGQKADVTALTVSQVQGLRNTGSSGTKLLTNTGAEVSVTDIKQIF